MLDFFFVGTDRPGITGGGIGVTVAGRGVGVLLLAGADAAAAAAAATTAAAVADSFGRFLEPLGLPLFLTTSADMLIMCWATESRIEGDVRGG